MLKPGDVFVDDFEIEEVLGSGGFATVYRARQRSTERVVAIKVLHLDDVVARQRFELEAQVIASLDDPAIVRMHGYGVDDGTHYMVLRFVEGRTLRAVIDRGGSLGPRRAVAIISDITRAVGSAHALGVLHRDLKPGNVILSDDDEVTVLDFGIAKLLRGEITLTNSGPRTEAGHTVGTPRYMAPEVMCGTPASESADVFGLGVLLYEMLVGQPILPYLSDLELIRRMVDFDPLGVPDDADVPEELCDLLADMMHKKPEQRLPDTSAVAKRLDALPEYAAATRVVAPGTLARLRHEARPEELLDGAKTQLDAVVRPVPEAEDDAVVPAANDGSIDTDAQMKVAIDRLRADAEARMRGEQPSPQLLPDEPTERQESKPPAPPPPQQSNVPPREDPSEEIELDRPPERKPVRVRDWRKMTSYAVLAVALLFAASYATGLVAVATTIENGHPLECGFGRTSLHIIKHIEAFGVQIVELDREIRCTRGAPP